MPHRISPYHHIFHQFLHDPFNHLLIPCMKRHHGTYPAGCQRTAQKTVLLKHQHFRSLSRRCQCRRAAGNTASNYDNIPMPRIDIVLPRQATFIFSPIPSLPSPQKIWNSGLEWSESMPKLSPISATYAFTQVVPPEKILLLQ